MTTTSTEVACGTYAGRQRHTREGTVPCTPCRQASAAYMRAYRANNDVADRESWRRSARERALVRLAKLHPGQYQILLNEELGE